MAEKKCGREFGDLRLRAEETLGEGIPDEPENLSAFSSGGTRRLFHELQIHQVELEMQNEDLLRAQLELEGTRARYFELYDLAPVGYVTLDQRGLIENANLTAARLLGRERNKLAGEPLTGFIAREDQDSYYLHCKQLFETGGPKACEMRMSGKGGAPFWAQLEMDIASGGEGEPPACRVVIIDISGRKQAEDLLIEAHLQLEQKVRERTRDLEEANASLKLTIEERNRAAQALRESEAYFRNIVEALPIAFFCHTAKGISFANSAAAELTGATPADLLGQNLADFLCEDEREKFTRQFESVLLERVEIKTLAVKLVTKRGTTIDAELLLSPFIQQGEPAVQISAYNLTERKKIEEEIAKADKFESISVLAGGIAHDFNNYLATVLGNITLAKMQAGEQGQVCKYLENMEQATHRVKFISNQLFTFAKGAAPVRKVVSLKKIIRESTSFALTGTNVRCRIALPEDLHLVEIDEGQIAQVLNNVTINAVQAMPEGGTILVAGKNVALGAKRKDRHIPLPAGEYVKISIKDEGPGIPEDLLHKIFDPFFSTKEKGSGLGLATAYSIIANHAGFIQVESQIGKGATFTIYLPASTRASLPDIIEEELVYGTGRILVVDDEAGIREVVGGMLAKLGYEVRFAEDGAEAIDLYRKAKKTRQPFDLLVMDLTIPGGMGGKEAIKILRREDPDVKAVVSSGYSDEPVMANYAHYGFQGAIKKPYTISEVSRVVHAVINRL